MNCVYIGRKFYSQSGSYMSSVYRETTHACFERTDWGFIEIALEEGADVHLRPATPRELKMFEAELRKLKK